MNTPSAKAKNARIALLFCALGCGVASIPLMSRAVAAPKEAAKPGMIYTEANDGQTVKAHVGEIFEVRLESNASTGYSWDIATQDAKILESLGDTKYVSPTGTPPGTPGLQTFRFKAKSAGNTQLVLHYQRPWEKDKEPAQVFSLGLQVAQKK